MTQTEYDLGIHCGITFAGIKAASLVNLKHDCRQCVRRYARYFGERGFRFVPLREAGGRILIYIYNSKKLAEILTDHEIKDFLSGYGYEYHTCEQAVEILKSRIVGEDFPHEIGVFLNYPLDDVKAFIAHPNDGVKLTGYWKVYGCEEEKRQLFQKYDRCTKKIMQRMESGFSLESIFCKNLYANNAQ